MALAQNNNAFEGVLLIDKPVGITSHDVVNRVRRKLRMRRVGHAGTLDPNASGLLIIMVGRATKASQYLMSQNKSYEGILHLGIVTDSQDSDGEIIEENEVPELTEERVLEAMNGFKGDQYQTPPMFSAKKVNGVPLYKMARKGKTVEREPRFIRISAFELLRFESPEIEFFIHCSKGTYVRTLAHDLGRKLGCGGHLSMLNRTSIGSFEVEESIPLEDFEELTVSEIREELIPVSVAVPKANNG